MAVPARGQLHTALSGYDDLTTERLCLENLLASSTSKFYFKDLESRFVRLSAGHVELFRATSAAEIIGKTDFDFFSEEHARTAFDEEQEIIRTGCPLIDVEERETWPDRPDSWVLTTKMPIRDDYGRVVGTFGLSRDITESKRLLAQLNHQSAELVRVEAELRRLLESSPDAMLRYDNDLRHVYVNPAATAFLDRPCDQVLGRTDRELGLLPDFLDEWEPALRHVLDTGTSAQVEFNVETPTARFMEARMVAETGEDGLVNGVFVIARDLTDRKRAEDALAAQAVQDPLTGLANRVLLVDRLQQALVRLERHPGRLAVLFLDVDRFKVINDSLGHGAGDALLVEIAQRLRLTARRSDTVARFGGDEFVMLCEQIAALEDVAVMAGRISRALAEPFGYGDHTIHITASIGIAVTDDPLTPPATLIRDADAAMYQAKERGRGNGSFQFFDAGVRERAVARMEIDGQLRQAIERAEFRLFYQPLVTLDDERRLLGVEALIRWQHPERGLLAPAAFMAVAEDTNLIIPIGRWVLDEACRQLTQWNATRSPDNALTVAVNVSARQLSHPDLATDVAAALARYALPAHLLTIEVTESALLEDAVTSAAIMDELAALGVQLALDDFGTGYSSLGHLRRFPVNILKIDRSFVDGLGGGGGDVAIVAAVTAMAHAMGMTTVGEGIETARQFDALRELGCDEGQGYLMSRPLSPSDLEALLADRGPL